MQPVKAFHAMSNTDQGDGKPPFMKQTEVPTDPAQGYDPLHDSFMKRGDVPTDNPGAASRAANHI